MTIITLQLQDGAVFQSRPAPLGLTEWEGAYYVRQNSIGQLKRDEHERLQAALEGSCYRLQAMRPEGRA